MKDKKTKILVIDDDPMVSRLAARILENDATVLIASTYHEAKAIFDKNKFDAVLVDVNLGADNGIDLAVRFRDLDPLVQIIVMSGDLMNEEKIPESGLGEMLRKPFTSEELRLRLSL